MFLKKDAFTPDAQIIKHTQEGMETKILIGEPLGVHV